jgi:hypothetical protein
MRSFLVRRGLNCIHEDARAVDKGVMPDNNELRSLGLFAESHDPFDDLEIPPFFEESLLRHRSHLVELVRTMKVAGVREEAIEESVSVLVAMYKEELMVAIRERKVSAW